MSSHVSITDRLRHYRASYWQLKRLWFPSPAETEFMKLMGARLVYIKWLKSKSSGFRFTFVISRGRILRRAKMRREVRYGKYFVDFANDLNWIIEVDGRQYHMDVLADEQRQNYIYQLLGLRGQDVRFLRIPGDRLQRNPERVRRDVIKFLSA